MAEKAMIINVFEAKKGKSYLAAVQDIFWLVERLLEQVD
jgi:hypothetical protein